MNDHLMSPAEHYAAADSLLAGLSNSQIRHTLDEVATIRTMIEGHSMLATAWDAYREALAQQQDRRDQKRDLKRRRAADAHPIGRTRNEDGSIRLACGCGWVMLARADQTGTAKEIADQWEWSHHESMYLREAK